jgi:(1->4)-alpha-D-glucan 1-alpha-D-glucosylmutase
VEDTAFYRQRPAAVAQRRGLRGRAFQRPTLHFHSEAQRRRDFDNLLATATHDHKRGETAARWRAGERSPWLASQVEHWRELAAPLREALEDGCQHPAPAMS